MSFSQSLRHPRTAGVMKRRHLVGVICVGIVASLLTALGRGGQTPAGRAAAPDPPRLTRVIYGARHCAGCHDQKNHPTYQSKELEGWICRMVEFSTFDTQDKHKLAFAALTGPRGQHMSKLLKTDVRQFEACLNCHSLPTRGRGSRTYTPETDGVTCVACHGARAAVGSETHVRASNEWRATPRPERERASVRDDRPVGPGPPPSRSTPSCHIGSFDEGKVVTHDMYAAGHPPLPCFETATFGDLEPRHWQFLSEKTPERLSLERESIAATWSKLSSRPSAAWWFCAIG